MAFYRPAMVKGTFAIGGGHGIFSGNANGFQGPSFSYQTLVILSLYKLHLLSCTVFSSPCNPIQFLSIWMNVNILIHNHSY